jgi:hypothetical protein
MLTVKTDTVSRRKVLKWTASILTILLQTQIGSLAMAAEDDVLKFDSHDLNIQVYSAGDLRLVYAGLPHELAFGETAREKTPADAARYPGSGSGPYLSFASLVEMEWRSKDGTHFKHTLDLDSIFKDRKVLHDENPADIYKPMPISGRRPTLIIEVNDRTVNVYMFTSIQLIPKDPNALLRDERDHRVLAYSKTF